jgi:paraquat-inducible protein A
MTVLTIAPRIDITDAPTATSLQPMDPTPTSPGLLCPQCDLVLAAPRLDAQQMARCPRCELELDRGTRLSSETVLALALSAVPLWVVMNAFPLITLTLNGERRASTLFGAALALANNGMPALAALVVLTAIAAPAVEIGLALHILGRRERLARNGQLGRAVRWFGRIKHWSMVDVFLLGCLVSVVKLANLAQLVVGPALWASALLLPVLALVTLHLRPQQLFRTEP